MHIFELTRTLVDIESTTANESGLANICLSICRRWRRGRAGAPSGLRWRRGASTCWPRGGTLRDAVDAHGYGAAVLWVKRGRGVYLGAWIVRREGHYRGDDFRGREIAGGGMRNFGLLFVVGEERNRAGAEAASESPRGSRFLINGEPTENEIAVGSKGALRFEIRAREIGALGVSGTRGIGDSRAAGCAERCAKDCAAGGQGTWRTTLNVGSIAGGRAPNVVADEARAEIMFRTVGDPGSLRAGVARGGAGRAEAHEALRHTGHCTWARLTGWCRRPVAFTTDVPALMGAGGAAFDWAGKL